MTSSAVVNSSPRSSGPAGAHEDDVVVDAHRDVAEDVLAQPRVGEDPAADGDASAQVGAHRCCLAEAPCVTGRGPAVASADDVRSTIARTDGRGPRPRPRLLRCARAPRSWSRRASTPPTCPGSPCPPASLGVPDLGLIGLDDVAGAVRRITAQVTIPVIADIDTGFGGPLNVRRTVIEVEAAGAAAVQIEDQVAPKRCGHFEDKEIVVPARRRRAGGHRRRVPPLGRHRRHRPHRRRRRHRHRRGHRAGPGVRRRRRRRGVRRGAGGRRPAGPGRRRRWPGRRCCTTPSRAAARRCSTPPRWPTHGVRILIHPVTLLLETIRAQRAALVGAAGRGAGDAGDAGHGPRGRRRRRGHRLPRRPPLTHVALGGGLDTSRAVDVPRCGGQRALGPRPQRAWMVRRATPTPKAACGGETRERESSRSEINPARPGARRAAGPGGRPTGCR